MTDSCLTDVLSEMVAFAESLKREKIELISWNANISLLSIKVSAQIFDNINSIFYIQHYKMHSYNDNLSVLWVTLSLYHYHYWVTVNAQ